MVKWLIFTLVLYLYCLMMSPFVLKSRILWSTPVFLAFESHARCKTEREGKRPRQNRRRMDAGARETPENLSEDPAKSADYSPAKARSRKNASWTKKNKTRRTKKLRRSFWNDIVKKNRHSTTMWEHISTYKVNQLVWREASDILSRFQDDLNK